MSHSFLRRISQLWLKILTQKTLPYWAPSVSIGLWFINSLSIRCKSIMHLSLHGITSGSKKLFKIHRKINPELNNNIIVTWNEHFFQEHWSIDTVSFSKWLSILFQVIPPFPHPATHHHLTTLKEITSSPWEASHYDETYIWNTIVPKIS